jgi:hypothetical protein
VHGLRSFEIVALASQRESGFELSVKDLLISNSNAFRTARY